MSVKKLNNEKTSIKTKINLLIDSYTSGLITKSEFEPRITTYRECIRQFEVQILQLMDDEKQYQELQQFMEKLEYFAKEVNSQLVNADWETKRSILTSLVKLIEIDEHHVNIIFKVNPPAVSKNNILLEDCTKSRHTGITKFHKTTFLRVPKI